MDKGSFIRQLQCNLIGFVFDARTKGTRLVIPGRHSADRDGAIQFALSKFPETDWLTIFRGDEVDVMYRIKHGRWLDFYVSNFRSEITRPMWDNLRRLKLDYERNGRPASHPWLYEVQEKASINVN